jgi:hypothetical protein
MRKHERSIELCNRRRSALREEGLKIIDLQALLVSLV